MSNGYGIDVYGKSYYGYSQPADYSVSPFTASQTDYNEITLNWGSPNITSWKMMQLVRSVYGYPSTALDGVMVVTITPSSVLNTYSDPNLIPGTIYYYTMFLTVEAPAWSSATTYQLNSQILFNGQYWTSLQNANTNHTPAVGSAWWGQTDYIPTWLPAGYTASQALLNQGYGQMLYDRTPQPYKIVTSDTFSNTSVDNPALKHYLSLFGFGLDLVKGSYDSLLNLNNPDVVSATNLDILGQQLGINTSYLATPQQRRQRVKNAAVNYRMKGQTLSIHNMVAELTGWDSDITYGPNSYLSPDHSALTHPKYDTWNPNTTYFVNQLVQYNGFNYKNLVQSVGQAQAPTGGNSSNTWWSVQNQVLDTTVSKNPRTGTNYVWGVANNDGIGALNGVLTGLLSPISSSVNNANALSTSMTNSFSTGSYYVYSVSSYITPNYSASNNYVVNNMVLYTDGYYYRAAKPSGPGTPYGAITPGRDQTFWQPFYFKVGDVPNIISDGIPITHYQAWDSAATYQIGDKVQYRGIIYEATIENTNSSPSGFYYSNTAWNYLNPAQKTIVSSAYFARNNTVDTNSTLIDAIVEYYDATGRLINNTSTSYTKYAPDQGSYARFALDYLDIANTTEPTLPGKWSTDTPNAWKSSYGMAWADQTVVGTTPYVFARINSGSNTGGRYCATFLTEYQDSGHYVQGILFNYKDSNNFYYVTRSSLRQVQGGVDTILSSWDYIPGEFRVVIDADTNISVYQYARDGLGTLNLIGHDSGHGPANNAGLGGSSGNFFGLIRKYSATGDL